MSGSPLLPSSSPSLPSFLSLSFFFLPLSYLTFHTTCRVLMKQRVDRRCPGLVQLIKTATVAAPLLAPFLTTSHFLCGHKSRRLITNKRNETKRGEATPRVACPRSGSCRSMSVPRVRHSSGSCHFDPQREGPQSARERGRGKEYKSTSMLKRKIIASCHVKNTLEESISFPISYIKSSFLWLAPRRVPFPTYPRYFPGESISLGSGSV